MSEPLSQQSFDLWREDDTAFKRRIETFIENQHRVNLNQENRTTALEEYRRRDAVRLGVFSSLVSAVIGGVVGWFGSWR